eukprot:Amastigsp_a2305_25.p2 type:complete len:150 gc:universal Amastigsp_a2305_25:51-500(+)
MASEGEQMNCAGCGRAFFEGQPRFRVGERSFHVPCFSCAKCHKMMMEYSEIDGEAFCKDCTAEHEAEVAAANAAEDAADDAEYLDSLPICGRCGLAIEEQYLSALDKAWHPNCFICDNPACPKGRPALLGYKVANGRAFCCAECKIACD